MAVPAAMPKVLAKPAKPEVTRSPALSLMALPGDGGVRTRSVAILAADGVDGASIAVARAALLAAGATVHVIAARLGSVKTADNNRPGAGLEADGTFENSAPVLFDGLVLPDGAAGVERLGGQAEVFEFISSQHKHGKTILALGASKALLEKAGIEAALANGQQDPGVHVATGAKAEGALAGFILALGKHRHPEREAAAPAAL